MGHKVIQGQREIQAGSQVRQKQHASQGVQAGFVQVGVDAEAAVSQTGGHRVVDLGLQLVFRQLQAGHLLFFRLFPAEIFGADDLLGGGLFKGRLPDAEPEDPLEGGKFLVVKVHQPGQLFLNVGDAGGLRVFEVGINFSRDGVVFLEDQDLLHQPVSVEHVLQLFRGHVLSVA